MSAEKGNRYAEKWTVESTLAALEKVNKFAMMEDTLYLGMALARAGYYDDIWRYWRRKWARHYEIIHEMKQLSQHFEARLFMRAASGKMPVTLGMFALRHHYGWGKEVQPQEDMSYMTAPLPTSTVADRLSEGEGFNTGPHPTLPQGEDLMQTAGPIQTFPQGEGFNTNGHLTQILSKGEGFNRVPIQTFPQGEGLYAASHPTSTAADRLSKGECSDTDPRPTLPQGEGSNTVSKVVLAQEEVDAAAPETAEVADAAAEVPAVQAEAAVRHAADDATGLTPELLELEVGISDIREIERRLREEDPELAEYDDTDEDMDWEVETPETYRRSG